MEKEPDTVWLAAIKVKARAFLDQFDESRVCPKCGEKVGKGVRVVDGKIKWAHEGCAEGMTKYNHELFA